MQGKENELNCMNQFLQRKLIKPSATDGSILIFPNICGHWHYPQWWEERMKYVYKIKNMRKYLVLDTFSRAGKFGPYVVTTKTEVTKAKVRSPHQYSLWQEVQRVIYVI